MGTKIFSIIAIMHWALFPLIGAQNCDFQIDLIVGQEYFIYNPFYPQKYASGAHCTWNLRTALETQIFLSCTINLPMVQNCNGDRLVISPTGNNQFEDADVYCGDRSFSLSSTGTNMYLGLFAPQFSQGGTFFCTATSIKSSNSISRRQPDICSNCDCGWTPISRIVGGTETGTHEFPYMAALVYLNAMLCGASIISDRFSLTAAHCVLDRSSVNMLLLVGDHNIVRGDDTSESALYKINAYEIYPQYNHTNQQNDIAILRTETQISFSPNIGPVCLPFRYSFASFDGQPAVILGWGQVQFTGRTSDTLQKAQVYLLPNKQCSTMQSEEILDGDICTYSNEGRDSCQFDSGGPVLWFDTATQRYQLVGVISRGEGCASASPSINIRVTEYLQWIISRTSASYCIK